jgi:hypothetical protein
MDLIYYSGKPLYPVSCTSANCGEIFCQSNRPECPFLPLLNKYWEEINKYEKRKGKDAIHP